MTREYIEQNADFSTEEGTAEFDAAMDSANDTLDRLDHLAGTALNG